MGARLRALTSNRDLLALGFLTVFVLALYLPNLGSYAFWDPWEPHYSQVSLEMADHGTWLDPWYRGENRWWSKPILPLWLLRASFATFGVESPEDPWLHFAGRLPFALFGLLGVLLTYGWVSRLYNRRTGVYAGLVLATTPMYALIAHQIMFDMPFVAFCTPAVGYYILARSPQGRPGHLVAFYALSALAFLSKWLLAFFIPAGILFSFLVLRWDTAVFKRVGLWHWLVPLGLLAGVGGVFFASLHDLAFAGMLTGSLGSLVLIYWMGRDAAVEMGGGQRTSWFGFGLLLLMVVPWHAFMIARHGWPFLREAVIYHHFDRAAGAIGKPEGTFDVYVQQLAFALYPWVTLVPAALIRLLRWGPADLEGSGKRDLWLFLAAAVPYAAFSLFLTKFHHYIFPVVPFLAVIVAVYLERMTKADDRAWMRLSVMLSLPLAAILLSDILHDYKYFIHLFDYYYGWPLPPQLNPYPFFAVIGGLWVLLLCWLFFQRRVNRVTVAGLVLVAAALSLFLTAWVMPRVTRTFTQEPLYRAFQRESDGKAPIAQFNGWLSRSVSFYFYNKAVDLSQADQPNLEKAIAFLSRPGRTFMILGAGYGRDCRALLADLRPRVRERLGKSLYVVFDQHPFSCLVSTERDPAGERRMREALLSEPPSDMRPLKINFDNKIELVGYKVQPPEVERGETFTVSYFFRCLAPVGDDWLVFIHGDGPQGGSHRVFGDHAPLGGLYPTSEWQVGDLVRDDSELTVPTNYPYEGFTLWMGFWRGASRLPVADRNQHDGSDRVRTAYVRIQ